MISIRVVGVNYIGGFMTTTLTPEQLKKLQNVNEKLQESIASGLQSNVAEFGQRGIISDVGLKVFELSRNVDNANLGEVPKNLSELETQLKAANFSSRDGKENIDKAVSDMKAVMSELGLASEKVRPQLNKSNAVKSGLSDEVKNAAKDALKGVEIDGKDSTHTARPPLKRTERVTNGFNR